MRGVLDREKETALSHERLRELLHYDPVTGIFTWIEAGGERFNRCGVAGSKMRHHGVTHIYIGIDYRRYFAHRLAWFYMTGSWPDHQIDHRDRDGTNNRWANLREATHDQNLHNMKRRVDNSSGVKGVYFLTKFQKYEAEVNGKYVGRFATLAEAKAAREAAARQAHGEFYNGGSP